MHSSSGTKRGEFLTPMTPMAFIVSCAMALAWEVLVIPQIFIAMDFLEVAFLIIHRTLLGLIENKFLLIAWRNLVWVVGKL